MQSENKVKENYDNVYKHHNSWYPEWNEKNKIYWVNVFLNRVKNLKPRNVLEVGCGNGRNLQLIANNGIDLYGVDISIEGITHAQKRKIGSFVCGSAKKLPFDDDSFDLVFSVHALEQMKPILREVTKEIYRVVKPGGNYLCFEPFFSIQNKRGKWYHICAFYPTGEIPIFLSETGFVFDKIQLMKYDWGSTDIVRYLFDRWHWIRSRNRTGLIEAYKK